MPEYEIQRWDAVIPKGNDLPYPAIYIKPDKAFLDYAKANNYMFLLTISGTGLQYDNKSIVGMFDSSGYYPNYRPNFFNDTGLYVITILTNWIGYPQTNGKVLIQGVEGPDKITAPAPQPFTAPKPLPWDWYEMYNNAPNHLSSGQISCLLVGILVIFSVLALISCKKHSKSSK